MSQWTHIAGIVRLDLIELVFSNGRDGVFAAIEESFGNTCEYADPESKWEACNVPRGSEGSVQYQIFFAGKDNALAWGHVCIFGDLRDRGKDGVEREVLEWINKAMSLLNGRDIAVRQLSVVVEEEDGEGWLICLGAPGIVQVGSLVLLYSE